MRLLIGEFAHESNTFASTPADRRAFEQRELLHHGALVDAHAGKRTVLGGFLDVARSEGHDIIPSIAASALPSGPITGDVYRHVLETLRASAAGSPRPDAVLLSLHGAMAVEEAAGVPDPEGAIVAALRQVVGRDVPIAAVLDLHSDTTDLLLENADITLAYNEEPHRDAYDRGVEAAGLVSRMARGELRPVSVRDHPPMLLTGTRMATDSGPMHDLHLLRAELEREVGVIDISIHGGFFASDQREAGFSVVCTTNGDRPQAARLARQVADAAWRRRREFLPSMVGLDDALRRAVASDGTTVLVDEADDPAAGGPGDSVILLKALLDAGVERAAVTTIKDEAVARAMADAGEGATLGVRLGGKTDDRHGRPVEASARVVRVHRGPIPADHWSGRSYDVGIVSVLDISGILAVVTEQKVVTENIDILEPLGIDMRALRIVGCKGLGLHIRQALAGKYQHFELVDTAGVTHRDVRKLGRFRHIRRPIWPLDDIADDAYPPRTNRGGTRRVPMTETGGTT